MDFGSLIDRLVSLVDSVDPTAIVPELNSVLGWIELTAKLFLLAPPVILLALGLWYLLKPPGEANHFIGYRFYFGMGSVEAWKYTQRVAGTLFTALGGVLLVVMGIVALVIGGIRLPSIVSTVLVCLIIQLVLIAACCIAINVLVYKNYDKDGYRRIKD